MKILILDSWKGKFASAIAKHWESMGHEVLFNPLWDEIPKADLIFFYQSDNTLVEYTHDVQLFGKKRPETKVYAGCIDIESWVGQTQAVDWNKVDGLTFISKHIMDRVLTEITPPKKVSLIKPGINLETFKLRACSGPHDQLVRKMAYVVGDRRIWDVKRLDVVLMLLRDLLDTTNQIWQLHVLGSYSTHVQYNDYCEHLLDSLDLRGFVFFYDRQESVNTWLEDKDYFVLPSTKEAFSYATAEAMAKGIKPVIGNWRGAQDTWGPFYCKTYGQMFKALKDSYYNPTAYRQWVVTNYDENRYFKELDQFVGLGGEINV